MNCLQEICDKNGEHIGRESTVRLWRGLRVFQTVQFDAVRRNRKRVTGVITYNTHKIGCTRMTFVWVTLACGCSNKIEEEEIFKTSITRNHIIIPC